MRNTGRTANAGTRGRRSGLAVQSGWQRGHSLRRGTTAEFEKSSERVPVRRRLLEPEKMRPPTRQESESAPQLGSCREGDALEGPFRHRPSAKSPRVLGSWQTFSALDQRLQRRSEVRLLGGWDRFDFIREEVGVVFRAGRLDQRSVAGAAVMLTRVPR